MIVKRFNGLRLFFGAVLVFILSMFASLDKQKLVSEKNDVIQYFMTMDSGFSSLQNLVDTGNGLFPSSTEEDFDEYRSLLLPSIIKAVPSIVSYKFTSSNFDKIYIDIDYLDYKKILNDRARAIKTGLLSSPTTVNAKIRFKGEFFKVKLRLKGDFSGHWSSKYRMSLRVSVKNNQTILGNSRFSLQKPKEREFPYDDVFQSIMYDVGNLSAKHNYVNVYVNGSDWGIMDMEEHISKVFLEKQRRKESAVVRFSDEKLWLYRANVNTPIKNYRISDPALFIKLYGEKKNIKDYQYRKMYSYIFKQHTSNNKNLYDVNSLTKAYILSTIWGNWHTLGNPNSRYYFNPYTLKLESISTDASIYIPLNGIDNIRFNSLPKQYKSMMLNQSFKNNLFENYNAVHDVASKIQYYFDLKHKIFPVDAVKSDEIIIKNIDKVVSNWDEYLDYSDINNDNTRSSVKKIDHIQATEIPEHLFVLHHENGDLKLYNLLPDDIIVKSILYNKKSILRNQITVPSYLSSPDPIIVRTPYLGIQDNKFTVKTEYQGVARTIGNNITLVLDGIDNPLLHSTDHEFDFIHKQDDGTYKINKGNWTVSGPIIIKGDLYISPGTNMSFSKDSYIIVKGSLTAIGNKENPISLKSELDSWKGVYVLNASSKSHIKNIDISNISALEDGLLKLTGGITFYRSDVEFENVKIDHVKAEDAINIVESSFSLNSVYVNNTISDGLDSDFSKGTVLNSEFLNIGGDALDFSGSNVLIIKTKANNIKDKAVSAGEKSILTIKGSKFNNIGVGIASKDGSSVIVTDTEILNYKLYGAMSYLKKDFYDMPSLTINNSLVSDGHAFVRQEGTKMIVDGIDIPEGKINVKKLYKTKVMMK